MAVAGLDIGTGGCKCTVFADNGKISTYSYREYSTERSSDGFIELNPDLVWNSVCHVLQQAGEQHKGDQIEALCITSFGETGVFIDENGNPLRNSLMYTDFRGEEQSSQYEKKLGAEFIASRSGHSPHPMYSVSKIMWVRDNEPEIYKNTKSFLQYADYILFKLSGEKYVDWSLASRTCLFNIKEKVFDSILIEAAGIEGKLLPKPIQTGEIVGEIKAHIAQQLGLNQNMKLLLGGHDQISAALGGGVLLPGQAVNGIGSVDCITPLFDHPIINKRMTESGFGCIPYMIPDHYVTYAFNYSGGAMLKWYMDNFGKAVLCKSGHGESDSYAFMEMNAPSDPTDLLVLPHIQGAATPYMDTEAIGAIIGLDINTEAYSLFRGILEGVAYEARVNLDALKKAGINVSRITACGGGSRSPMWMQIRADIFNMPVDVLEFEEAGTLGAAILAGTACGIYKDISDGTANLVRIKKTYYPNDKNRDTYNMKYEKYKRIYNSVRNIEGR